TDVSTLPWIAQRFELQELVGCGGLGEVYKAIDHRLERPVAVKRMRRFSEDGRAMVEQAWREAMTTACLQHPNIVTIFDYGLDELGAYVVMEYVDGENFEQCLERGPLHIDDFMRFARESLEGLAAAHATGLIHRDIKPGNFMLQGSITAPFHVKILDFGLAKYVQVPTPQTVDQYNALMGSLHYMAPEQFLRLPIDHRADLYSLGCILHEALTGTIAFDGETIASLIDLHVNVLPPSVLEVRPDVSPELDAWLQHFLQKESTDRYQSALDALADFTAIRNAMDAAAHERAREAVMPPSTNLRIARGAFPRLP
ncbi:MAG TPA: serine/threonine-protein kinase, partial [Candidatus Methylacidiphilales bacterium]|nr:serine/threonine-protein kinase [Candidatus Methylacidiphilales bacterium]